MEYSLCTSTWGEKEWRAGLHVLKGGHTTMGEHVRHFERLYAAYCGTQYAVMVNSGSSANLLMVAALFYTGQLSRTSRVAVPAVAWSTTVAPLAQFGMKVVVVDVDDSLTMDPDKIPDNVDALFVINTLGNPCDFARLPSGPILLEDNCEAMGAEYAAGDFLDHHENTPRRTGSFGKMASHSLFFSHHISCMEGGVITTDDEELWRTLVVLRSHGWTRDLPEFERSFDKSFEFVLPGYNVRPTEVQGIIAVKQLERLPDIIEARRANGRVYKEFINHQRENGASSWMGFPLFSSNRKAAIARLRRVQTRPILAGNILRHDMMRFVDLETAAPTPFADRVHDEGFYIGNHGFDVTRSLCQIADMMKDAA